LADDDYSTEGTDAGDPGGEHGDPGADRLYRARGGVPWERRDELGPGAALIGTVTGVLFSPGATFSQMKREGGWGEPLGFAVVVGSVGVWVAQIWDMVANSMMAAMTGTNLEQVAATNAAGIWVALFAPLLVCAATFFGAAITHLLLIMLGGAPQPYETTFRVICYTWSVSLLNVIPICGIFIAAIWRLVAQIIGLREAQEIRTGQAAAAVLIPFFVACFCLMFLFIVGIGVASFVAPGFQ